MSEIKYIGMDVHKASISVAVLNESGKLTAEATLRTEATTVREFLGTRFWRCATKRGGR